MSLRDQLLKSGLAHKDAAKKAEKEAKKRQHQKLQQGKSPNPSDALDQDEALRQEILEKQRQQKEQDRERNRRLEEERRVKEEEYRAIDLMMSADQCDPRAQIPYYYRYQERWIGRLLVTEQQVEQLASGNLAIASFDLQFRVFLLETSTATKVRQIKPEFLLCWHSSTTTETPSSP